MISNSRIILISLILYLFSSIQSSSAVENVRCSGDRTGFSLQLVEYIEKKQISKVDQDLEMQALKDRKVNLLAQLDVIDFELNAQTSYTKSRNSFGSSEKRDVKNTNNSISATMAFSKEERLKKEKTRVQIKSLEKQIILKNFRHRQETLKNLLDIINLRYQIDNANLKLPVIESQIEYLNMLRSLGTPQTKELTDAELEKLRIKNELVNLEAKLNVEKSKLTSEINDAFELTELPISAPIKTQTPLGHCVFIDPDHQIKRLNLREQEINLEIAQVKRIPKLQLEFSLSSKDYHPGAHANNASMGVSLSAPLFDGGVLKSQINEAQQNYSLAKKDFAVHKIKFEKKASNFFALESSLMRSLIQAKTQIENNYEQMKELSERQSAGFSVFRELSERKLQQYELAAISRDIKGKLLAFCSDHLENFVEYSR